MLGEHIATCPCQLLDELITFAEPGNELDVFWIAHTKLGRRFVQVRDMQIHVYGIEALKKAHAEISVRGKEKKTAGLNLAVKPLSAQVALYLGRAAEMHHYKSKVPPAKFPLIWILALARSIKGRPAEAFT